MQALQALQIADTDAYIAGDSFTRKRKGTGLPNGILLGKTLKRGTNNTVHVLNTPAGQPSVVARFPRVNSDTRDEEHAQWEFRHAVLAARLGVGPALFDAWYTRNPNPRQRKGLHMILERCYEDWHSAIFDDPTGALRIADTIGNVVSRHFARMAGIGLFAYDLKASNIVLKPAGRIGMTWINLGASRPQDASCAEQQPSEWLKSNLDHRTVFSLEEANTHFPNPLKVTDYVVSSEGHYFTPTELAVDAKIIDFGCDFCEYRPFDRPPDRRQLPVLDAVHRMCSTQLEYTTVLRLTMLILLASNIANELETRKVHLKMSRADRNRINPFHNRMPHEKAACTPRTIGLVKKMLRLPDLKAHLTHYNGRRNNGVKRTFRLANFTFPATDEPSSAGHGY